MNFIKELQRKKNQQRRISSNKNNNDLISELSKKGIINKKILESINKTPREFFVDENLMEFVYENIPLPISCKQTISQPFVVAYMIDSLKLKKTDIVLEIGTGTGYQTALLANLCKQVYTIEIFNKLFDQAKVNHERLKLKNISYMLGNAMNGWKENILFDAIIISASTKSLTSKLLHSLKKGGKLIYPKKYTLDSQKLILINKINEHIFNEKKLFDVKFVPLLENI